jgi:hypothetical protein
MPFQRVPVGRVAQKKIARKMPRPPMTMAKMPSFLVFVGFFTQDKPLALTFLMLTRASVLRICVFVDER